MHSVGCRFLRKTDNGMKKVVDLTLFFVIARRNDVAISSVAVLNQNFPNVRINRMLTLSSEERRIF